jgi:hypothetical protein
MIRFLHQRQDAVFKIKQSNQTFYLGPSVIHVAITRTGHWSSHGHRGREQVNIKHLYEYDFRPTPSSDPVADTQLRTTPLRWGAANGGGQGTGAGTTTIDGYRLRLHRSTIQVQEVEATLAFGTTHRGCAVHKLLVQLRIVGSRCALYPHPKNVVCN